MARDDVLPKTSRFVAIASICIVIAALYFGREVLVPLALAILLTFLLAPVVSRLERWHLGRVLSVIIVVALAFVVIGALGWLITVQAQDLGHQLGEYRTEITNKVHRIGAKFSGIMRTRDAVERTVSAATTTRPAGAPPGPQGTSDNPSHVIVESQPAPSSSGGTFQRLYDALALLDPLFTAFLVVVFVIFMLIQREDLRDRLIRLIGPTQLTTTTQALDDAAQRVSKYLVSQAMINGSYAVVIAGGLWLLGVKNAPLWGLLCGLLRFIPYVGVWVGAACPILLAFAISPTIWKPLEVLGLFLVVEIITANAAEPLIYGASTGVSSLAVLVAAVFWTWLWGGVGLLLSTPLTVCLAVIGKYVPQMEFLSVLLGDEPVLSPPERVYQRLLARDVEEPTELVEDYLKTRPLEEVYDEVLIPALRMAERDRHRGELTPDREAFIRQSMREILDDIRERRHSEAQAKAEAQTAAAANAAVATARGEAVPADGNGHPEKREPADGALPKGCVVNILCLPAHDENDEIAALMLADLLEARGYCAFTRSSDALASEMVEAVPNVEAQVVCVSALPPGAISHARYLCKRLHAKYPELRMVVGLWTSKGEVQHMKDRIACEASVEVVTSFKKALREIHQLVQPLLIESTPAPAPAVTPAEPQKR